MDHTNTIPIFVIVMPGSSRFDPLKKRLIEFNIPFEKVDAIDGHRIDKKELAKLYNEDRALKNIGRPMTPGEIGNALSHRKVWRSIIERNLSAALVLEEDAVIDQAFCSFLRTVQKIPKQIGFLSLYTQRGRLFRRVTAPLDEFRLHRAAVGLVNTVAYVITAKYARMLLNRGTRVECPTDWPCTYLEREQYLVLPMPVSHYFDESVIERERATMIQQRIKPLQSLWPTWIPSWLRAIAYVTCIVYLLRPDRYDGVIDYFKRRIAMLYRLAIHDTVIVERPIYRNQEMISKEFMRASPDFHDE